MAKVIIECNTNGEAFELLNNLLYAANETKIQAYKDYVDELDRVGHKNADFYAARYRKFKELGRQIANHARVEL